MDKDYMTSVKKQFEYYKVLGERTFVQLNDEQLFWQYNVESNSIAIIVKHLWGNMMSRWTDFLTSDGEKEWRQREAEFDADIKDRAEMMDKWNKGWTCLFDALNGLSPNDMTRIIYIRNLGHTVYEALHRQLAHYSYHVGQITYIGRMVKGSEWQSLSIPRGQSKAYNENKFAQGKRREHFTDEYLNDEK